MTGPTTAARDILWLRRDLRLGDNPALLAAAATGAANAAAPSSPSTSGNRRRAAPGLPAARRAGGCGARCASLDDDLRRLGSRAARRARRPGPDVVAALARAGRRRTPWSGRRDSSRPKSPTTTALETALAGVGVEAVVVPQANLLADPLATRSRDGQAVHRLHPVLARAPRSRRARPACAGADGAAAGARRAVRRRSGRSRGRGAAPRWTTGLAERLAARRARRARPPGEPFWTVRSQAYASDRDRMDLDGSSRLSPHLRWGELTGAAGLARGRGHAG